VAVVALVGTLGTAFFPNWFTAHRDELKRKRATDQLLSKYRDPLLLATQDLQSSCYAILKDRPSKDRISKSKQVKEDAEKYNCYLWGQYLSWVYILRHKFQFLAFSLDKDNKDFARLLGLIESIMTRNITGNDAEEGVLWRYSQTAIGELMTLTDAKGEMRCMGYSAFAAKWDEKAKGDEKHPAFKRWFAPIQHSLTYLEEVRKPDETGSAVTARLEAPELRFQLLQHALLDLRDILDPKKLRKDPVRNKYYEPIAELCGCCHCNAHSRTTETV
jgi:hypothetical protein